MSGAWTQEAAERNVLFVTNLLDLAIVFSCYVPVSLAGLAMMHSERRWWIRHPVSFLGFPLARHWFNPINYYLHGDTTYPAWMERGDGPPVRIMEKVTCNVLEHARLLNGEGGW